MSYFLKQSQLIALVKGGFFLFLCSVVAVTISMLPASTGMAGTQKLAMNETVKDDTWYACITPNDIDPDGLERCTNNLTILNKAPTAPELVSPPDGSTTSDRTPTFIWLASGDSDGDSLTYQIMVDNNSDFSSPEINQTGLSALNYTPPSNMGVTLGGSDRLRSYPTGRFSDKAAIYYTAELRLMPQWVGFRNWPLIRALPIRWWQTTLFGELGRVAAEYDLGTLHDDLNSTVGFSVRMMIGSQVMRFEFAHGDEANQFWFLVGQPF